MSTITIDPVGISSGETFGEQVLIADPGVPNRLLVSQFGTSTRPIWIAFLIEQGSYSFPPEGTYRAAGLVQAIGFGDDIAASQTALYGDVWSNWVQTSPLRDPSGKIIKNDPVVWVKSSLTTPGKRIMVEFYINQDSGQVY